MGKVGCSGPEVHAPLQRNCGIHIKQDTQCTVRNHCYRGRAVSITHSECLSVAVVIQYAKRMRLIILSSVAYLTVQYFFTLS